MNKEKFVKILNQYSEYLKKYGIYLLVTLFFLTLSLNYFLGQMKNTKVEISPDLVPAIEIAPEKFESKDEEESPVIGKTLEEKSAAVPAQKSEVPKPAPKKSEKEPVDNTKFVFGWPVRGEVLKGYGLSYSQVYDDYRLYSGIDISTKGGIDIITVHEGKVSLVEKNDDGKLTVEVDHGKGWLTHYSQLAQAFVSEGKALKNGEKIGQADTHLHFRIKKDGSWVDPLEYLPK